MSFLECGSTGDVDLTRQGREKLFTVVLLDDIIIGRGLGYF